MISVKYLPHLRDRFRVANTLTLVTKVIGGNVVSNMISMVTSILIARWVGPYEMGVWNTALLVTVYTPVLQLGIFNGLNRELPYLVGKGRNQEMISMAEAASAWCWILAGVSTFCSLLVTGWFWMKGDSTRCATSIAIATMIICSWPTLYLTTTYRTRNEFGRLAKNMVAVSVSGAALVLLVWRYHYFGLITRGALLAILGMAALFYRRPLPVKPHWRVDNLIELAKVGIPIWLVGQLSSFFMSMDRLMLAKSTEVLGYFTIAIQVTTFVRQIPTAFAMVLYPQMTQKYGENHCAMDVWRLSRKGAFAAAAVGLFAGVAGWFILPSFVRLVLPRYIPGIPAARWAAFIGFAMGFYMFDNIYNVIKRQDLYILNWCLGCLVFFGTWHFLAGFLHISIAVASSQAMIIATLIMSGISAYVSRMACKKQDMRLH